MQIHSLQMIDVFINKFLNNNNAENTISELSNNQLKIKFGKSK